MGVNYEGGFFEDNIFYPSLYDTSVLHLLDYMKIDFLEPFWVDKSCSLDLFFSSGTSSSGVATAVDSLVPCFHGEDDEKIYSPFIFPQYHGDI